MVNTVHMRQRAVAHTDKNPAQWFAAGAGMTIFGSGLLAQAVRTSAVRLGACGLILTAGGLWLVNERVRVWGKQSPIPFLAGGTASVVAGAALMKLAFARSLWWLALVALAVLVAGLLCVAAYVAQATREGAWWNVPVGLVLGSVSLIVPARALGAGLAAGGLLVMRRGFRRLLSEDTAECERHAMWIVWGGAVATAVGAVLLVSASRWSNSSLAYWSGVILAYGITALSEGWPRLGLRPVGPEVPLVLGVVLFVIGLLLFMGLRLKLPFWPALAIALLIALIGASFVMRGEGLLLVVAVGFASVWVLLDRSEKIPTNPNPTAADRIVAFGDSYISGEGAATYFQGTNRKGAQPNQCRRSPTAFPYVVAKDMGMALDFFACSGAKADDLHLQAQQPDSPPNVVGGRPQVDNLPADVSSVKVALVSIGGNDALFGDVGKGCLLPGSCESLREMWLSNLDQIGPRVTRAYEAIKQRLPGVPVVAIPYALMLEDHSCDSSLLLDAEHEFLSEFVTTLNDRIRVSAANAGVHYFDSQLFAYEGARVCGSRLDDAAVNFVALGPVEGTALDRLNPANWTHNSLHPNRQGHARTAELLADHLRNLLNGVEAGSAANPAPDPGARFRLRNVATARPVLARHSGAPDDLPCPVPQVSPFASATQLFDERSSFVINAVPDSPVCFTRSDGSWVAESPATPGGDVILADQEVRVIPQVPDNDTEQQVIYNDRDLGWHLRTVRFCSQQTGCPTNVDAFVKTQLAGAAREVALPVLMLFAAGWLAMLGLWNLRVCGRR